MIFFSKYNIAECIEVYFVTSSALLLLHNTLYEFKTSCLEILALWNIMELIKTPKLIMKLINLKNSTRTHINKVMNNNYVLKLEIF